MYVAKFRQYIVPHSVAYVCIQSVCDSTQTVGGLCPPYFESGGVVAPPAVAQVLPMLSIDGRLGNFKCRVNRASHTQIYPLSHAIFAVPMHYTQIPGSKFK